MIINKFNINIQLIFIQFMESYQKKEQDYAKWDQSIWLSVEKEVSQFQTKVNASMVSLGSLNKTKAQDFKVQPLLQDDVILGQQFYVQVIRPIFVTQGYLPKQAPTQKDLQDEEESDQQQEQTQKSAVTKVQQKRQGKVKQQKKGGGKKGSKNNQNKNQAEVKMKIVKQNFMKDIDLLLNSHSLQRMQYQYGLKQKKLQVRLMTFFYIAYYIRKNKQKQKIDEAQTFELINILVKIVRIFDGYKGKSFFTSQKKKKGQEQLIEVSRTLILDIKLCIKGLKQMYKYSNKKVIINYPKLVYYTNYDRFFPTLDIKPYPSQIQFIQAVKSAFNIEKGSIAKPTLILYRTMIGSGKTSASISLANLINQTKLLDIKNANYQVLYSCLISSVRVQVGRYAYHSRQKFALAAMEKSIKYEDYYYPRIINSYFCRNQKVVDLVISDLVCSYTMLSHHHLSQKQKDIFQWERKNRKKAVNLGMLDKQNIIMFIDEPTAFCKDVNSPATQKLFHILGNYPPKVIILASATMPPKQQLKNTIALVEQKNPGLQVIQIESKQFQIGCQYSSFKGQIIFPHTGVKTKQQLKNIIKLIQNNPFLLRLYTGPSLYFLLRKCQANSIKGLPKIQNYPQIRQQDISKCTIKILKSISQQQDSKIQQICRLSADEANIDYKVEQQKQQDSDDDIFGDNDEQQKEKQRKKKQQEQERSKTDYVNFKKMLRDDAYKFLGGCLIAVENPQQFAKKHFEKWMIINRKEKQSIKSVRRLLQKYKRQVQALQREIKLLQDDPRRDDVVTKLITKLRFQKQPKMDFPDYKRINTADHYKRYCKDKQSVHQSMLIKPMPIQLVAEELIQQVDDFTLRLLFCGVALYMQNGLSSKYLDKVEELASQNYLAYIITDQSLCYGTNFPISNVILCDDLVQKLNMNQIFQLIGRAGRVGQSWTARAFLEEKGLLKLHNYIHSQDKKMSEQAQIFEIIAKDYLDNPNLCLRTLKSQIKYIDEQKPDERLQIIIKKKNVQDYHIFRKIVVVPYLESDKRIMSYKHPHQSINYFELAQSEISYYDLPTKKNSQDVSIINVQAYYKNEQQFIRTALNNAVARVLKQKFQGKISIEGQVNQFKPKVYEQFFCMQTNTFVVLVKCKDDIKVGNFAFNKLVSNSLEKLDENLVQKIQKYIEQCKKMANVLRQNPQSIFANDVKQIKAIHADLMQRPKTKYYRQTFKYRQQEIKKQYDSLVAHVEDKGSLEAVSQSVVILFVSKYCDFANVEDRLFHIDSSARKIWQNVLKQIQK